MNQHSRTIISALLVTLVSGVAAPRVDAAVVVPEYDSLPGATAKLFIDFDGITYNSAWAGRTPGTVPAYSVDADTANFSTAELNNIREIFMRVAEKYSPFNINVTTRDPGSYNSKHAARIVVGGNGDWYSGGDPADRVGGVAFIGSFAGSSQAPGWAFPNNLANGNPKTVAECIAHEAGHQFGLNHQSAFNASGVETQEYSTNGNDPYRRPIMGSSYGSTRGLWWNGTTTSATSIQDDLSVLSSTTRNGFGYRLDDHASVLDSAEMLVADGSGHVSADGVIERVADADMFSFVTGTGSVSFSLAVAQYGAMLDATLRLFTAEGALLRTVNSAELGESFTNALTAGEYVLGVYGHGNYGDIGQYTLSGQLVAIPEPTALLMGMVAITLVRRRRN